MLLDGYYQRISQAVSINNINKINIAYSNTMTPQEILDFDDVLFAPQYPIPALQPDAKFSEAELKAAGRLWINESVRHLRLMNKHEAEPFLRRDLRQSVTLYTAGGATSDKTLVVAFPGANNRLMMPVCALLQALDAARVDIVLIRDPTHSGFFNGLEGLADTRAGVFDALPSFLNFDAYRQVSSLGVSRGGLPSLLLALRLSLHSALVCGAGEPSDQRYGDIGGGEMAEALRSGRGTSSRVTLAFGAQDNDDRRAATQLADTLGIEALEISNAAGNVGHNLLFELAKEGRLPSFLRDRLSL